MLTFENNYQINNIFTKLEDEKSML